MSGPVYYVPRPPGQATFRRDSQNFGKIKWSSIYQVQVVFLENENGGTGIFLASFRNMTNEAHLLFISRVCTLNLFSDNICSLFVVQTLQKKTIWRKTLKTEKKTHAVAGLGRVT